MKGKPGKIVVAYKPLVLSEQPDPYDVEKKKREVVYQANKTFDKPGQAIEWAREAQRRSRNRKFKSPFGNVRLIFTVIPVCEPDPNQLTLF